MFVHWKIERTPLIGGKYDDASKETISGFHKPSVRVTLGSQKDSFSFNLINTYRKYSNKFQLNDKITIYRKLNSTTVTNTDILMVGVVNATPETRNSAMASLKITGYNYTEAMLNALITVDPKGANLTIPFALKQGIESIAGDSPETFPIEWDSSNPTLKQDSTAFPTVDAQWFNTPLIDKFEKYSQNTETEDGTYIFWITNGNKVKWLPRTNSIDYSFDSTTEYYHSSKPDIEKDGIINYVQIQGGNDPKGSPIEETYVDESSKARHSVKYKFDTSEAGFAPSVNQQDIFDIGGSPDDGTLPSGVSGFSYPHQFSWQSGAETTTSDSDYVNKFRIYIKSELLKKAKAKVDLNRYGKQKITYVFSAGEKPWGLGDLVNVTYYDATIGGNIAKSLRVNDIKYNTTTDTFILIEDIGSV